MTELALETMELMIAYYGEQTITAGEIDALYFERAYWEHIITPKGDRFENRWKHHCVFDEVRTWRSLSHDCYKDTRKEAKAVPRPDQCLSCGKRALANTFAILGVLCDS